MSLTIDDMINFIEQKVCIRKIWRANAGWGMFTIPLSDVDDHREQMARWYERIQKLPRFAHDLTAGDRPREPEGIVECYYPSLEECVRAEYRRWVQ